jgi:hypothetical protein
MTKLSKAILCVGAIVASAALVTSVSAQVVTGSLGTTPQSYGSALALQSINTGFGDSTVGDGTSAGGSELDAAYGQISGGYLYLMLTGNFESNGNHANVFVAGGAAGQSTLALPATASMATMNGSQFSPGFQATYAFDMNDYAGTAYVEEYTSLGSSPAGGYVGAAPANSSPGVVASGGSYPAYATVALNDYNVSTMGSPVGGVFTGPYATTGLELAIPLSAIGYTGGSVEVLADINGGGDSYLSNQFLPELPTGYGNLGNGGVFNFSSTPGEYFTVVPEPSSIALVVVGLLGAIGMIRRRKA